MKPVHPTMPDGSALSRLTPPLLAWYHARRRTFPWRENPTPYRVWVSEIMLQQTRIMAALPYFDRFMEAFPTVEALASADEHLLLKIWEGLGYYSRARNLQKTARILVKEYGGELPASYDKLIALPGIGEYTAGAIASIAFGQAVPAVDGNVLRVMARLLNCDGNISRAPVKRALREAVCTMLPLSNPGDFNQAVMELGETICLPNTIPLCEECPLSHGCAGYAAGNPEQLPVRPAKKERRIQRRTIFVIIANNRVLLRRRPQKGLLAGLWELPGCDNWLDEDGVRACAAPWGATSLDSLHRLADSRHIFSHVEWHMQGVCLHVSPFSPPDSFVWADAQALRETYALPSAFRDYIAPLFQWLAEETK